MTSYLNSYLNLWSPDVTVLTPFFSSKVKPAVSVLTSTVFGVFSSSEDKKDHGPLSSSSTKFSTKLDLNIVLVVSFLGKLKSLSISVSASK